jgi:hypothetical protein
VDEFQREYRTTHDNDNSVYELLCHKVATLDAHDEPAAIARCAEAIREDSRAALQAIATRLNQEYVFEIPGGVVEIFAGPGSTQTFRHAFFKRLAEAYFNLSFLLDNNQPALFVDATDAPQKTWLSKSANCLIIGEGDR